MANDCPLPNFIHFGTPKSGSGTLSYILHRHPQVYTPRPKELNFFNSSRQYDKGLDWYKENYFSDYAGQKVICDKSIGYSTGNPERTIRRLVSALGRDFRILLTVRNPVDRAYSQYCMARFKGQVDNEDFTSAVLSAVQVHGRYSDQDLDRVIDNQSYYGSAQDMAIYRDAMYLVPGHFARLLDLCHAAVGSQNVEVLFTEDMNKDLPGTLRKLTDFLGIDPVEVEAGFRKNEATTLRFPGLRRAYNKLYSFAPVRRLYGAFGESAKKTLRRKLLTWNYKPNKSIPPLPAEARALIVEHYASDIEEFQRMTDRDLSHWLPNPTGDASE